MKTYYTVYKITNKVNGKVYIGTHKTNNLDDNYMGSGKYLKYSQNKHGIENFDKEILFVFDNPEEMFHKEAELVNEDFIAEQNTYNLKVGGHGGWNYINTNIMTQEKRLENASKGGKTLHISKEEYGKRISEGQKNSPDYLKGIKTIQKKYVNGTFFGKSHTEETKNKISEKLSELQSGKSNSQYGTMWIFSLPEQRSMKINKNDPIPDGWEKGRKFF